MKHYQGRKTYRKTKKESSLQGMTEPAAQFHFNKVLKIGRHAANNQSRGRNKLYPQPGERYDNSRMGKGKGHGQHKIRINSMRPAKRQIQNLTSSPVDNFMAVRGQSRP